MDELPRFDIRKLDCLGQYARALMHAQAEYTIARKRPADIGALSDSIRRHHRVLLNDTRVLAARGLIQPEIVKRLKGCRRRADVAAALAGIAGVLRRAWPSVAGKTALTLAELDEADAQAMQLISALAHQKRPLRDLAQVAEIRQRAFTVFCNAYTQARRAVQYLCENPPQAERIIPTLYPRRRASKTVHSAAKAQYATAAPSRGTTVAAAPASMRMAPAVDIAGMPAQTPSDFRAQAAAITPLDVSAPERPSASPVAPPNVVRRKAKRHRKRKCWH